MSRSATDPLDPGPRGFAHRGLHSGDEAPENSLAGFAAALRSGTGIECDLRLTADNRILVFHDADAIRLCGSPAVIGQSTHAELAGLRVREHPVPTLEELLEAVNGKVPLLLEVKVGRGERPRWVPALRRTLAAYEGPFGVMSFDPLLVRRAKRQVPEWRRGLVVGPRLRGWRRAVAIWLADPHFLAVETSLCPTRWTARQRRTRPVYSWTVRTSAQRIALAEPADALIWEGDGRP